MTLQSTISNKGALAAVASVLLLLIVSFGAFSVEDDQDPDHDVYSLDLLASAELTDQHGNKLDVKDLRDKVVLMNFFFTTCGGACPVQTAVVKEVQSQLSEDVDAVFVSVSIAPLLDTQEAINDYIAKHDVGLDNWLFTRSTGKNTKKLIEKFGVTVDGATVVKDQIDHRNIGYLFGRKGNLMQQYQLIPSISKRLTTEMKVLFELEAGKS